MSAKRSERTLGQIVGDQVRRHRDAQGLRQEDLAARTAELGYPLNRVTISKIESGSQPNRRAADRTRAENVSLLEVLVLAAALDVPPALLFVPLGDVQEVRLTSKMRVHPHLLLDWVAGDAPLALLPSNTSKGVQAWHTNGQPLFLFRGLRERQDATQDAWARTALAERSGTRVQKLDAAANLARRLRELDDHRSVMQTAGLSVPDLPDEWALRLAELRTEEKS